MAEVKIVTDSACDLPSPMPEELDIGVVPVYLTYGDRTYHDGVDISPRDVLRRLRDGEFPELSQPSPGDFLAVYRATGYDPSGKPVPGASIVSIHVTSQLSGTYNSANLAAGLVPDLDVTVIDSRTGSMGTGFVVLAAARAARAGVSKDEIIAAVHRNIKHSAFFLVVPDLSFLHRAGRLGRAQAWLGQSLSLFPVLCVREGVVMPYRLARGYPQALKALVSAAVARFGKGPVDAAAVHVEAEEDARLVMELASQAFEIQESYTVHAGGAVTGALGPGTVGLCISKHVA
jgi:DegV family protein with EDD domain